MAKIDDLKKEAIELGIDTTDLTKVKDLEEAIAAKKAEVATQNAAPAAAKLEKKSRKSANLTGINPDDKMRLYKRGGKVVFLTIEDALKPFNFKQLSENSQKALTRGKSATKIVTEMLAE